MKHVIPCLLALAMLLTALPLGARADAEAPERTLPEITDEMLEEGYLDDWFEDALLIGDSLTAGLAGYVSNERYSKRICLGNMQLAYSSALTLKKACESELGLRPAELKFRNGYMTVAKVIETVGAKKAFLLLGVNDVRWYTPEELCQVYGDMLGAIRAAHPEVMLVVISITPMLKDYAKQVNVTAEKSMETNALLRQYCADNGYYYLELADCLRDAENFLPRELSASDMRFHLNSAGKKIWVQCMRSFVRDLYYQGLYTPAGKE